MNKGELIDSRVSLVQCRRAVDALHSHEVKKEREQQENELLPPKEQLVWLVVAVKKMYPTHKIKPFRIPIAHPIVDPRTSAVCLITKDPQREYKDLLEAHGIKFIARVVGITKLKGKFKSYEARRVLLKDHGMFLADDRVVPLLPALLGKKWFEAKKQPIPVCLTRKDLKGELEKAISSTYMHQNRGTCTALKIGSLSLSPSQILANIKTALPAVAKTIKGGWENIQSFHIKTHSSVSLPIWTCSLDDTEGGRWNGLTADENADVSDKIEEMDVNKVDSSPEEPEAGQDAKGSGKRKVSVAGGDEPRTKKVKKKPTEDKATVNDDIAVSVSSAVQKSFESNSRDTLWPTPKKRKTLKAQRGNQTPVDIVTEVARRAAPVTTSGETLLVKNVKAKRSKTSAEDRPVEYPPVNMTETLDINSHDSNPGLSTQELKTKRKGDAVERKKERLTKRKLGKSAKNLVVGKKMAHI